MSSRKQSYQQLAHFPEVSRHFMKIHFNVFSGRLSKKPDVAQPKQWEHITMDQLDEMIDGIPGLRREVKRKLDTGMGFSDLQDFWQTSCQFMIL